MAVRRGWLRTVIGSKQASKQASLLLGATLRASPAEAGGGPRPPLTPGTTPLRQRSRLGSSPASAGRERPPGGQFAGPFSCRPLDHRPSSPSISRVSPRRDRRTARSAFTPLRRRSPRPPGRTPPVPPPGSSPLWDPAARLGLVRSV